MKKNKFMLGSFILIFIILLSNLVPVTGLDVEVTKDIKYTNIGIMANGNLIYLKDSSGFPVKPILINNTIYAPVEKIADHLKTDSYFDEINNTLNLNSIIDVKYAPVEVYNTTLFEDQPMYVRAKFSKIENNIIYLTNCEYYTFKEWEAIDGGINFLTIKGYSDYNFDSSVGYFNVSGDYIETTNGSVYESYGEYLHKITVNDSGNWTRFYTKSMLKNDKSLILENELNIKSVENLENDNIYTFMFLNKGNGTGVYISAN